MLLLSYSVKGKLENLNDETASIIYPPNTDLEFLALIHHYLIDSKKLSEYEVYIAGRDDLIMESNKLFVKNGVLLLLQERMDEIGYPGPLSATNRMERQFGIVGYYCPFDVRKVISSSRTIPEIEIDSANTMIFDQSDDHPAQPQHYEVYEELTKLFKTGRVQTNPYFMYKKACHSYYGFSSSKNIAYKVFASSNLTIPGGITHDVNEAWGMLNEYKQVVLKVQDGTGGEGISFFNINDANVEAEFRETFSKMIAKQNEDDRVLSVPDRGILLQKFLPGIRKHGDTRVHLINGKVCLIAQRRIPKENSKLANLSAGATFETVLLKDEEIESVIELAKCIRNYSPEINSSHIGLDLLKGEEGRSFISEVNTWGIGLIGATSDFFTNYKHHEKSNNLFKEYEIALKKYKHGGLGEYILQNDILEELVGMYLP